jgi:hypothetical protein
MKDIDYYISKYKNKYRLVIITTPDSSNNDFIKFYNLYKTKYKKDIDKLNTIIKIIYNGPFEIQLFGFDGLLKYKLSKYISWKTIISKINNMPYQKFINNLSLYSDYHPDKSNHKVGFKDKDTAISTIKNIENKPLAYQYQVINTLYNRAKYHPHQTDKMRESMKIFKEWLDNPRLIKKN